MGEMADMYDMYDGRLEEENEDIVCKYCGETVLSWKETRGKWNRKKWILVNPRGEEHLCNRVSPEEL